MSFASNPSRDAGPTVAGFFFQVNVSILRWLDLRPPQHIELESGEDIDTVDGVDDVNAAEKRLLEQLKIRSSRSLTLRSVEALEAVANYCAHTHLNPGTHLLFRYLTTATIGSETAWGGTQPAIATWQAIRQGEYRDDERAERIELLRSFLVGLSQPPKISKFAWASLQSVVADKEAFVQLILGFEWAVGQPGLEQTETEIRSILIRRGYVTDEVQAGRLYEHLVAYIFRRLCRERPPDF